MVIRKIVSEEINTVKKMKRLRSDMTMSSLLGDCDGFKNAKVEYAKEAVKNFDIAKNIRGGGATVPLFSKQGLNMLKVMIYNFFRKKTPEEKQLKRMCQEDAIKNNKNINFNA